MNLLLMVVVTSHIHWYFYYWGFFLYEAKIKQGDRCCHTD